MGEGDLFFSPAKGILRGLAPHQEHSMDNTVDISRITADLEKKFNGDADHDVGVIQEYVQTLPPCDESAKLVAALGKYASEKFPDAKAFAAARELDGIIAELEKEFTDDINHNVQVIQDYCKNLPKSDENLRKAIALGQYAAAKFPDADEVKKSREEFEKMNEAAQKLQERVNAVQELVKNKDLEGAIAGLREIIDGAVKPEDDSKRLVSFSHPFEEVLFSANHDKNDTRSLIRVSNLMEMLNLQLGSLLAETGKYDEARDALHKSLEFNPVSAHAHLELTRVALLQKDFDGAFEILKAAYPFLFTRPTLAAYYCFLAEVVENLDKNYPLAVAYSYVSLDYAENTRAREGLNRLAKNTGVDLSKPKAETVRKLAVDAGLPLGPSPAVCELAVKAGRQLKGRNPEVAKQFLSIAYDLTRQESLLKEIR